MAKKQTITLKKSTVANKVPDASILQPAELAINLTDKILYTKDTEENVFRINPEIDDALSTSSTNPIANNVVANNINFISTSIESLENNKVDKVEGKELSTNDYTDSDKAKVDKLNISGGGTKFLSDLGQYQTLTKFTVGLDSVDNTSDLTKPISNAVSDALSLKADKEDTYTKEEIDAKVSSVYRPKGSKDTIEEVTGLSDMQIGDVWMVNSQFNLNSKDYPAGTNVVYLESGWEALGSIFDMSDYVLKTDITDYAVCIPITDITEILG